ncbi:hypothetical protein [Acidovorax sp. CCYZU-2555]|uniref:hypothetical protein n=1 Tax=Acidovorax sp. CCYZU-2555 TaxID=2835042 RepID=UPI001BCFA0BE|nr:hypothetical protein [Acidovorax sp. CCYZU-2555]MBS7777069.1 hypothetical protein [Acidovorax sp. CCYZU-2555]
MKEAFSNLLLSNKKIFFIGFLVFIAFIVSETINYYYIDTGDYPRVVSGILNYHLPTQRTNFLLLEIKDHFVKFDYFSSYTLILYGVTWLTRFFTDIFNLKIFASLLKISYIIVLFKFYSFYFKEKNLTSLIIFILASLPLLSSANLGIFSSFYQEQVVLIFLPLLLIGYLNGTMKGFFLSLLAILIISTAKSQFFYLPIFALFFYFLFSREKILKKTILLIVVQIFATITAFSSSGAVNLNRYHSEYFGLYPYQQLNGKEIDAAADIACIGVDAWGHKFDLDHGAVRTDIDQKCIQKNANSSHKKIINYFLMNPVNIISLLFDEGINRQVRENYFHVYYSEKIVVDDNDVFEKIKNAKDNIFADKKLILLIAFFILAIFFHKSKYGQMTIFLSLFALSQLYISFFGEGYRDLAKHLFGLNFSFDLILFLSVIAIASWIKNRSAGITVDIAQHKGA